MISIYLRGLLRKLRLFIVGVSLGEIPGARIRNLFSVYPYDLKSIEAEKMVFTTWRNDKLTKSHARDLNSFIIENKSHTFFLFDDEQQFAWMKKHYGDSELFFYYANLKFPAAKADIFRYCIISEFGGTFFSINRFTRLSLDFLTKNLSDFRISFSHVPYIRQNDAFRGRGDYSGRAAIQYTICAPAKHPVLQIAKQKFIEKVPHYWNVPFQKVNRAIWELTGPYLLTDAIDDYLNSQENNPEIFGFDFNDSLWIPKSSNLRYFYSPSYTSFRNKIIIGDRN